MTLSFTSNLNLIQPIHIRMRPVDKVAAIMVLGMCAFAVYGTGFAFGLILGVIGWTIIPLPF